MEIAKADSRISWWANSCKEDVQQEIHERAMRLLEALAFREARGRLMYTSKLRLIILGNVNTRPFTFHPNLQVVQGLNESERRPFDVLSSTNAFDFKQKKWRLSISNPPYEYAWWTDVDWRCSARSLWRRAVRQGLRRETRSKSAETGQELPETMLIAFSCWRWMSTIHSLIQIRRGIVKCRALEAKRKSIASSVY